MKPSHRRPLLLAGLIYLLLLLGLATRNGQVLALALPLLVYVAAALLFSPEQIELQASRTLDEDRIYDGSDVTVTLALANHGRRLEQVFFQDVVPPGLHIVAGESQGLACLPPGGTIELNYTVTGGRGRYHFGEVRVLAGERLGLIQRQAAVPVPGHLAILPKPLRLRRMAIHPFRTRGHAGPVPARHGGSGTDFFGVREYQVGDPRRWINWRVSARHLSTLFTNEFEWERIADVGLILDARQRTNIRLARDSLFEHGIQATSALAEAFLQEGNRVGLLVYGDVVDWTLPGYGKVQHERILQALARATTGQSQVFEHLDFLPTRLFPAGSQIVLVSPLCQDDLPTLIQLRAHGYQLMVIRPDPTAFELQALCSQPGAEMAARIVNVERRLLLFRMRQAGIQVVDWQVDRPFDQVVHGALARATRWSGREGVAHLR